MPNSNKRILLVDNYDSFTFNLYDYLSQCSVKVCKVIRNDDSALLQIVPNEWDGVVFSPGPCTPADAGLMMQCIQKWHAKVPILGVCLGHQALGSFFGASVVRANKPMHGKTSLITHTSTGIFDQLPNPMQVMRYHSLVIEQVEKTPLLVTSSTTEGEVMAIEHPDLPIWGVQFHPESILTPDGFKLIHNWVKMI